MLGMAPVIRVILVLGVIQCMQGWAIEAESIGILREQKSAVLPNVSFTIIENLGCAMDELSYTT